MFAIDLREPRGCRDTALRSTKRLCDVIGFEATQDLFSSLPESVAPQSGVHRCDIGSRHAVQRLLTIQSVERAHGLGDCRTRDTFAASDLGSRPRFARLQLELPCDRTLERAEATNSVAVP